MTPGGGDAAPTVALGTIVAAHGLRGLVRFRPYQLPTPTLAPGRTVLLERGSGLEPRTVVSAAPHGRGHLLLGLAGVTDRTAAEALAGARVLVHAADLPPLGPDEFYYHEVVGFRVDTTAGEPLGVVAETLSTGLNDVWVVRAGAREHLIPVIADVVRAIDRDARRIVIEPLPGLLELP